MIRSKLDTQAVLRGYVACALWLDGPRETDTDDSSFESLGYSFDDLPAETLSAITAEIAAFLFGSRDAVRTFLCDFDSEQVGHDFYLTRNGHGAGFWDRCYAAGALRDACETLSEASRPYGESNLYIGDDGALYVS